MSRFNAWLRLWRFAVVLVAATCLGATMTAKPADAQVSVGVNLPFFNFGFSGPGYYYPAYYPYYGYSRPYYRARYWRLNWCYYHPYRCGWDQGRGRGPAPAHLGAAAHRGRPPS